MSATLDDDTLAGLLDRHAPFGPLPLVPRLSAWQAPDELSLWQALEEQTGRSLDPPFFCVAWPGAQALARALLEDRPPLIDVRGRTVLDVGCGSGVAACAAALAGARQVIAADVDPLAVRAAVILGRRHGVALQPLVDDVLSRPATDADVILCGDLVYSESQRDRMIAALALWARQGRQVLVADSGRPFFAEVRHAADLVEKLAVEVDVPRGVEGQGRRTARVYERGP